jgi:hypothetical protein
VSKCGKTRRDFIKTTGLWAAALVVPSVYAKEDHSLLAVGPEPRFDLSPYLYMQFMEPLGTTDGSVAAAWDFTRDCWLKTVSATPSTSLRVVSNVEPRAHPKSIG